jgi:hypothetical protein
MNKIYFLILTLFMNINTSFGFTYEEFIKKTALEKLKMVTDACEAKNINEIEIAKKFISETILQRLSFFLFNPTFSENFDLLVLTELNRYGYAIKITKQLVRSELHIISNSKKSILWGRDNITSFLCLTPLAKKKQSVYTYNIFIDLLKNIQEFMVLPGDKNVLSNMFDNLYMLVRENYKTINKSGDVVLDLHGRSVPIRSLLFKLDYLKDIIEDQIKEFDLDQAKLFIEKIDEFLKFIQTFKEDKLKGVEKKAERDTEDRKDTAKIWFSNDFSLFVWRSLCKDQRSGFNGDMSLDEIKDKIKTLLDSSTPFFYNMNDLGLNGQREIRLIARIIHPDKFQDENPLKPIALEAQRAVNSLTTTNSIKMSPLVAKFINLATQYKK